MFNSVDFGVNVVKKILQIIGCWLLGMLAVVYIPGLITIGNFIDPTLAVIILAVTIMLFVGTLIGWLFYHGLVAKDLFE